MDRQLLKVVYVPAGDREREGWRIVADLNVLPERVAEQMEMTRWVESPGKTAMVWATKTYLWGVGRDGISRERVEQEAVIMNRRLNGLLRAHARRQEEKARHAANERMRVAAGRPAYRPTAKVGDRIRLG